jgi:hypothetical protein
VHNLADGSSYSCLPPDGLFAGGTTNGPVPLTSAALKQLEAARSPARPTKPVMQTQTPGRPSFQLAAGKSSAGVAGSSTFHRGPASAAAAGDAGSVAGLSTAPSQAWSTTAVAARFLGSLLSTAKAGEGSVAGPGSVAGGPAESEMAGSVKGYGGNDDDTPLFMISATAAAVLEERAQARQQQLSQKKGWFFGRRSRGSNSATQRSSATVNNSNINGQAPGAKDAGGAKKEKPGVKAQPQPAVAQAGGGSKTRGPSDLVSQWFGWIDGKPLACASIAQVHAATLSPELLQVSRQCSGSLLQHCTARTV